MRQYNACRKRGCLCPVRGRAQSGAIYEIKNLARKPRDADFVELSAIRRRRKAIAPVNLSPRKATEHVCLATRFQVCPLLSSVFRGRKVTLGRKSCFPKHPPLGSPSLT